MSKVSGIITAAGRNSRMEKDQIEKNIPVKNKLLLTLKNKKTIIKTTISNVLSSNVDECIVVLGYFADEIRENIEDIKDNRIKIIENDPVNCGLSSSLLNGINNSKSDIVLCVASDQPSIKTITYNNILKYVINSKDPKTISILRRRKKGLLKTAEGLGMPFAANKKELVNYLKNENDNLNPILRKMFSDGFNFYGIKEDNKLELININRWNDYKIVLNNTTI